MLREFAELFFKVGGLGFPGLFFGQTDKLASQLLETFEPGDRRLNHGQLWWGDALGFVFAFIPALKGKVRTLGASFGPIRLRSELASDDGRDLPDLLEDRRLLLR